MCLHRSNSAEVLQVVRILIDGFSWVEVLVDFFNKGKGVLSFWIVWKCIIIRFGLVEVVDDVFHIALAKMLNVQLLELVTTMELLCHSMV